MIEWQEELGIAVAIVALIVGLGMIYLPLSLIVPGSALLGWEAWRRRGMRRK